MPFYLTPEQDDFNQELQACIAEALYDVDSIVADPGAYTKEELASLHSQIVSNLEQAWELLGGSEDQLLSTMMQISRVVAREFKMEK
ncbi:MAG: hypothetical protein ACE1Z4_03165 [Gammaproteobacteria bacterium]